MIHPKNIVTELLQQAEASVHKAQRQFDHQARMGKHPDPVSLRRAEQILSVVSGFVTKALTESAYGRRLRKAGHTIIGIVDGGHVYALFLNPGVDAEQFHAFIHEELADAALDDLDNTLDLAKSSDAAADKKLLDRWFDVHRVHILIAG